MLAVGPAFSKKQKTKNTLAVEMLLAEDTVEGKFDVGMTLALLLGRVR